MYVSLHEIRIGPLVDIAQRRHLKARLVLRRKLDPCRICDGRLAEQVAFSEKSANAAINK